jgi:hypothetical protein
MSLDQSKEHVFVGRTFHSRDELRGRGRVRILWDELLYFRDEFAALWFKYDRERDAE